MQVAFGVVERVGLGGAGQDLPANLGHEALGGVARGAVVQAGGPAGGGQDIAGLQRGIDQGRQGGMVGEDFLQPPAQAAGAAPPPLGAQQPAAQLGHLGAGKLGGEGGVGGIEDVVAFVEDIAHGGTVLAAAQRGLDHDQGVVGHDQLRPGGAADGMLHEAAAPVRAAGMDAFAAPVGEVGHRTVGEELGDPAGKVAALHVAVPRRHRPAGDQGDGQEAGGHEARRGFLQVQQAEVVLPPLADDDLALAHLRVRVEAGEFAVDLTLEVAGVGGDPDRGAVALGPERGGGDIAQGLARAGAGLGQHDMRGAGHFPRREGQGSGGGEIRLGGALLGIGPEDLGEAAAGLGGGNGQRAGGRGRGAVLPVRQAAPDLQRIGGRARILLAQGGHHGRGPGPVHPFPQPGGEDGGVAVQRQVPCGGEAAEDQRGEFGEQDGGGFVVRRHLLPQRHGEAARRRRGGLGRQGEGEELQQVIGHREGRQAEAARRGRGVDEQRRRQVSQAPGQVGGGNHVQLAIRGQDRGLAEARDQGRCLGQQEARHAHAGGVHPLILAGPGGGVFCGAVVPDLPGVEPLRPPAPPPPPGGGHRRAAPRPPRRYGSRPRSAGHPPSPPGSGPAG
ncbi:Hypothetical protein RMHFA_05761 [Roseomonas mucosa]|nr:Hypothetical protein RMHFA_05761 [Roseomonas mucosa]